jgi:hypothetical protein
MGHFYQNILSTAFAAFSVIPARAGSSSSTNHPVYLALDAAAGATANFEVIGSSLVSAQQVHCFPPIISFITF